VKGKEFRKLRGFLGKLGGREKGIFVGFSDFSGVGVISGMAVMARRAGQWDDGKPEIPGKVADSGAGAARGERRWPERRRAVPAGFARRGERGKHDRGFGELIELSGKVLKTHVILAGDLLGAKNASVTTRWLLLPD
jgi:hypothetical protein